MAKKQLTIFIDELERISSLLLKNFHQICLDNLKKFGITIHQLCVLEFIFQKKYCKMSDLSEAFGVTLGNMTTMVDRLLKENLVHRNSDKIDRRIVRVCLSQKGEKIVKKIRQKKKEKMALILNRVEKKDAQTMLKVMRSIANWLEKEKKEDNK